MPTDADVMHNRELYSSVASCSSGVELDQAQVVVVGNARGIGGRYRIGHSVMQDALDQDGIWAAIRDAGLDLPERAHWSDIDGRLVNVFLKCEASQDGRSTVAATRCSTTPTCTGTARSSRASAA
jgi:ring-opening amidohydrolase-like protein